MSSEDVPSQVDESSSALQPLQSFDLFPKLPVEVQDTIWNLAISPRKIKIDIADPRGWHPDWPDQLTVTSSSLPLLSVCKASHAAVLRAFGAPFAMSVRKQLDGIWAGLPEVSFNMIPTRDTICFTDLAPLYQVGSHTYTKLKGGEHWIDASQMQAFKSIAVEDFLPTFFYTHEVPQPQQGPKTREGMGTYRGTFDYSISGALLFEFINLEQLIIVAPTAEKLFSKIRYRRNTFNQDMAIGTDKSKSEGEIAEFIANWERYLKSHTSERVSYGTEGVKPGRYYLNEKMSVWWESPKITLMTEEEFHAAFI